MLVVTLHREVSAPRSINRHAASKSDDITAPAAGWDETKVSTFNPSRLRNKL